MCADRTRYFALKETEDYAMSVVEGLDAKLSRITEEVFADGEYKLQPDQEVRGCPVVVFQSLYSEPQLSLDHKICRLVFFCTLMKDLGADRITAVIPYLGYSRQDRRQTPFEPITNRYLATLLETSGVDRVITLDVHNLSAFENAYRIQVQNAEATELFVKELAPVGERDQVIVVSPDAGGVGRAKKFALSLSRVIHQDVPIAIVDKARTPGGVKVRRLLGDVSERICLVYDDMISTGSTIHHAAQVCMKNGAKSVIALATHGIFSDESGQLLDLPALSRIYVTDTISRHGLSQKSVQSKLEVLCTAPIVVRSLLR